MAKKKEWLTKLKEQGKIASEAYDKYVESLKDEDMPDEVISAIDERFMTFDRAINDEKVRGKIKSETLDAVDLNVNELIDVHLKDHLEPLEIQELKRGGTYKKLELLKRYVPGIIKKVKTGTVGDEESKKQLKELQKTIDELGQEKVALSEKFAKDTEVNNEQWTKRLEQTEINYHLDKLSNKFTLAEAFEQDRDAVNQLVLGKVKANSLKILDTNGQKSVVVTDEHGKPKYNGNTPVTIQSLLEEGFKPYLKKSETPPRNQVPPRTSTIDPQKNPNRREGSRNAV